MTLHSVFCEACSEKSSVTPKVRKLLIISLDKFLK